MDLKIFLLFSLVMAIALLSSSEVAARYLLAETSANMRKGELSLYTNLAFLENNNKIICFHKNNLFGKVQYFKSLDRPNIFNIFHLP